jgi:hypothetical protein
VDFSCIRGIHGVCFHHALDSILWNVEEAGMNNQFSVQGKLVAAQKRAEEGNWFPACDGTETSFFTRTGRKLLYCYQPTTGRHAYLDVQTDLILSDEEAQQALALY